MNAPDCPDCSFNTLTDMLAPLKTTRRDKMRQNETVCARVSSAMNPNETSGAREPNAACTKTINATRAGTRRDIAMAGLRRNQANGSLISNKRAPILKMLVLPGLLP